jgi:hypothetical protein
MSQAREGMRTLCHDTSSLRAVAKLLQSEQGKQTTGSVNNFCERTQGGAIAQTDEAFGRSADPTTIKFAGHAAAGDGTQAIQAIIQASLRLHEANKLNQAQLTLLTRMAENQADVIQKLLTMNKTIAETGLQQLGRVSDNETHRDKIFADFAIQAIQQIVSTANTRAEVERDSRRTAEELGILYKRDRDQAQLELQNYLLSAAIQLSYSAQCLGSLDTRGMDIAFCARFPEASQCKVLKVPQASDCK